MYYLQYGYGYMLKTTYFDEKKMRELCEKLIAVEEERFAEKRGISVDELDRYLDTVIEDGG